MQLFTIIQLCLITLSTLYLLYFYSAKNVPFLVKLVCFISWFFSFAILIFVPLDVFFTAQENTTASSDQSGVLFEDYKGMITVWRITYWTNFVFSWFVLPFFNAYVKSGDFTRKERIKGAIRASLINYAVMATCGLLFFVYLKLTNRVGEEGIFSFFITYANCFGIALIIFCLSYGLVSIPKRCFQHTKQDINLRTHQFQAAIVDETRDNLLFELYELVRVLEALQHSKEIAEKDKDLLLQIQLRAPPDIVEEIKNSLTSTNSPPLEKYSKLTKAKIVELNRTMKKRVNALKRAETQRAITIHKALFLEDITDSETPSEWRMKYSYSPPLLGLFEALTSTIQWVWYVHVSKVVFFILGMIFVGFSILIFIAEILNFVPMGSLNIETLVRTGGGAFTRSQILCLIPLAYICTCVYSALFSMKVAGRYGLYKHHHTDAASLIFSTMNFARVSSPMVFNFLQMMKVQDTAFNHVMGNVNLAYNFTKYFPLLLIVLVFCNIFEIYGKTLAKLGLSRYRFNEETTNEKIEDGKTLLYKIRKDKNRVKGQKSNTSGSRASYAADEITVSVQGKKMIPSSKQKINLSQGYYMNPDDRENSKTFKNSRQI